MAEARRDAAALACPRQQAETVRRLLHEAALLDPTLSPTHDGTHVRFPLAVAGDDPRLVSVLTREPGLVVDRHAFAVRPVRGGPYTETLSALPAEVRDALPSSFDVVGRVALLKLPEPALAYRAEIGAALLAAQPHLETVALDRGVKGDLRVRDLDILAGRPSLRTIHREHGLDIEVDLDHVYFSPRLATERQRLAARVRPGQRILDLFAGVGAFVCLAARTREPSAITAIDLNPHAVRLLFRNLERNRVPPRLVDAIEGDARQVAPRDRSYDHVVMNLPHDAASFLDVASACLAPGGEVHLYAMVERAERSAHDERLEAAATRARGAPMHIVEVRHVRNYSPTADGLGYTLSSRTA